MRNWITIALVATVLMLMAGEAIGQHLPRRVYLGIRMENLTEDAKSLIGIGDNAGILIAGILPKSTAEKAGFRRGDILTGIDGQRLTSIDDLMTLLANKKAGDPFTYELLRDQKTVKGKSVFQSFPVEEYADLEVIYTESNSEIGQQRIILTRQKTEGKKPLVVFIGGIGCYSLDTPMDTMRSEIQLLNQLSRSGYACARLEKPGMGDNANYCKSCQEVSFMEEMNGYVNAVEALKKRDDIDSASVFIFGHSMGGVFAPLVAQQTPIKGIIAYGTIGCGFIEYLAKTRRTIAEAYAFSPVETDELITDFCECASYYYVEKMTTSEAAVKNPVCGEYLSMFDLRSRAYNDELYALNIPSLWSQYAGTALVMWGKSDYVAAQEDHEIIAKTVNYYHSGHGTFKQVDQADHGMNLAESFQAAVGGSGVYNRNVGDEVLQWLDAVN